MVAAAAVGADEVILYVKRSNPRVWAAVLRAVDERRAASRRGPALRVVAAPSSYVSGQETAAIAHLNGRPALPTTVPPRPFERGVDHRPTLHQQRRDAGAHGADRAPRRRLVPRPRVADAAGERARDARRRRRATRRLRDRLRQPDDRPPATPRAASTDAPQALLVGGYGGAWLDAQHMQDLTLERGRSAAGGRLDRSRRALGPRRAARAASGSPLACSDYLAAAERRPVRTVPARAARDRRWLRPRRARRAARDGELARLRRWGADVTGRGACRHPDGAARFLASALDVFAREIDGHAAGRCAAVDAPSLPLPASERAAA